MTIVFLRQNDLAFLCRQTKKKPVWPHTRFLKARTLNTIALVTIKTWLDSQLEITNVGEKRF